MADLREKRLFLLDMDGTIYLDHTLFPGTLPFLRRVRERGGRYLFLTNNSSRSVDAYVDKLAGMGVEASAEDFLTSTDALISRLNSRPPYHLCYAFGTAWFLVAYARAAGPIGLWAALGMCVFPFVVPDLVKLALAWMLSRRLAGCLR